MCSRCHRLPTPDSCALCCLAVCFAFEAINLSWSSIVDDSRKFVTPSFWGSAKDMLRSVVRSFAMDKWKGQRDRVILCSEKNAIMSMLSPTCYDLQLPCMEFHGNLSDGSVHKLAEHIAGWSGECRFVHCFYLGDYDPEGCNIDRVIFGDPNSEDKAERHGKLRRLLWRFFDDPPTVMYERIGIVHADVNNPEYSENILKVNTERRANGSYKSSLTARFLVDTEVDDRILGVDALSHAELESRVRIAVAGVREDGPWKK